MKEIANTGERILLEKESPLMIARHFCAYRFAEGFIAGRDVLDIGCGEGYGADFLALRAARVVGIDYDPEVIDYAKGKYRRNNLGFLVLDVRDLDSLRDKFDVICSFQNIEHIRDTDGLLRAVSGLLKDNGIFICSTCNKSDASPGREVPFNKFHVREYSDQEFGQLLKSHFRNVEISGLRRALVLRFYRRLKKAGIFNLLPAGLDPVKKFFRQLDSSSFYFTKKNLDSSLDFIAVCSR